MSWLSFNIEYCKAMKEYYLVLGVKIGFKGPLVNHLTPLTI